MNELLDILREQGHRLPKDARTLLQTPRSVDCQVKCGGKFAYFGIENGILRILAQHPSYVANKETIWLNFNIDGVPLFKSSSAQFWPILCYFGNFQPFVVALFYGEKKPFPLNEYINEFVTELEDLKRNGISKDNRILSIKERAFKCDAPARAFIKCISGHSV